MPLTGWLIKIKYLFLIILEVGKSEVVTITDLVSGKLPVLIDSCLLTITSQDEGGKGVFSSLFYKGINSIYESSALII